MKMNIVDHAEAKAVSAKNGTKTRPKWPILLLLLVSVAIGAGGCTDYYAGSPAYGPGYAGGAYGPGYAGGGYGRGYAGGAYGPGYAGGGYGRGYAANGPYAPGYAGSPGYAYPGSVTVEIGDRPYYTHGPGYYVGRTYYVWRPGHWANRHGQRVWIRGHYVVRG